MGHNTLSMVATPRSNPLPAMSNIIRGVRCLSATLFLFQMGWSYRPLEMMIKLSSIFHTYRRQLLNHVFSAHPPTFDRPTE